MRDPKDDRPVGGPAEVKWEPGTKGYFAKTEPATPENVGRLREYFQRIDQAREFQPLHLIINGRSRCQIMDQGTCQFTRSEDATACALWIRRDYGKSGLVGKLDVRIVAGECPNCHGR